MLQNFSVNEKRSHESLRAAMLKARDTGKTVDGVINVSPMIALQYFDLSYGFVVDYMHGALIGVVKAILHLLFGSANHNKPYSLRKYLKFIAKDLKNYQRPKCQTRNLNIYDFCNWKANQIRFFILFCAYPVLKQYLRKDYINNLLNLAYGIYLLSQNAITEEDFNKASMALEYFSKSFGKLYGLENMTFNVHLMTHLPDCVKKWEIYGHTACSVSRVLTVSWEEF